LRPDTTASTSAACVPVLPRTGTVIDDGRKGEPIWRD